MRRWWSAPIVLPCLLLAFALVELVLASDLSHRGVALVFAPLVTLPLTWRTRVPLVAALGSGGAFLGQTVAGVPTNGQVATTIAMIVALFAVGRHGTRRSAQAGLGLLLAIAVVTELVQGAALGDIAFVLMLSVAAWLGGYALARRADEARLLTHRAELAHAHAGARHGRSRY